MIEIMRESHDNILGVKGVGKITAEDYEAILIPKVDSILAEYGKGNFLYYLSDEFTGFELGAIWDDAKYIAGHNDKFDRVALVGGPKWIDWTTKIAGVLVDPEVRTFSVDQLGEAWDWVEGQ